MHMIDAILDNSAQTIDTAFPDISNPSELPWVSLCCTMAAENLPAPPVAETKTAPPTMLDEDSDPDFDDLDGMLPILRGSVTL